ncbi:MAG TPA: hypothetical protein VGH63_01070 [Polyangia bacterium]
MVELRVVDHVPRLGVVAALAAPHVLAQIAVRVVVAVRARRLRLEVRARPRLRLLFMAVVALGRLVLALERERGERVVIEAVEPAEGVEAEDVLVAPLVIGMAELALLAERLGRPVDALALALPLADGLVALEALVDGDIARADVAVLAMILAVDVVVLLGQRPRRRVEEIGGGVCRREDQQRDDRGLQEPEHGVSYQRRNSITMWMVAMIVRTTDIGMCAAFHWLNNGSRRGNS